MRKKIRIICIVLRQMILFYIFFRKETAMFCFSR